MPEYWQFPTVSMGLGPLQAIYQAHIMKYLVNRGLAPESDRKVWCFIGDGEMDEPESLGAISLAGREGLDNLIFVVNCNLQRLDGPVRGNGKIIQELEGAFRGAGWNVIKVVWGRQWDALFEKDTQGLLQQRMDDAVDGDYQNYKSHDGGYVREHFFGAHPELSEMVSDLTDEQISRLNRGGHDPYKVYAAYAAAVAHKGQPTVILAKTVKGYGLGLAGEAQNFTHSVKKLDTKALREFRDRFDIPINDEDLEAIPYYRPPEDSIELRYLKTCREKLGGAIPSRLNHFDALTIPDLEAFASVTQGSGDREISTTMAFVRLLSILVKDPHLGERIVPIVPDEARTFGMEGMFRQLGIYSSVGQLYEPVDTGQIMSYREDQHGQVMEEGINEGGAFAAWLAAATSYSNHAQTLVPFYIYYSMFGFQRIGDLCWAAGDLSARGFLLGGTSGRTTLNGEGLQHQDGHSHILSGTVPNCVSYDPTYAYELAVIIQHGLQVMFVEKQPKYFYITITNENYQQPAMPEGCEAGIKRGLYLLKAASSKAKRSKKRVQLLGSGAILREVLAASDILQSEFEVFSDIFSVTSFNELKRDGDSVLRWNRLNPDQPARQSHVQACLGDSGYPSLPRRTISSFMPIKSGLKFRVTIMCSEPMALVEVIPARSCAVTSKSIGSRSPTPRCRRWRRPTSLPLRLSCRPASAWGIDPSQPRASDPVMALKQISVPDVGEAEGIELVEVLVAAGDVVKQNQSLVVLESDKASVELPAAFDGVVVAVLMTPGMTVKEGDVLLTIETSVSAALTEAESEPERATGVDGPDERRCRIASVLRPMRALGRRKLWDQDSERVKAARMTRRQLF